MDKIEIDEERGIVIIETEELDPNGFPLYIEYTIEEWESINQSSL